MKSVLDFNSSLTPPTFDKKTEMKIQFKSDQDYNSYSSLVLDKIARPITEGDSISEHLSAELAKIEKEENQNEPLDLMFFKTHFTLFEMQSASVDERIE